MTESCSNDWADIITWAMVFGGWFIVHKTTLSRERRKEKREVAHKVCSELRSLECQALDFHTAQSHDSRKATDLRQDVDRLIRQLQRPPLSALGIPLQSLIQLRRSITRQNADPSDFFCQTADSELVQNIRNAITDLIGDIGDRREQHWK